MMKTKHSIFLLFAAASLAGLGSCADIDTRSGAGRVAVVFVPQIEGASTRAVDQTWSAGDSVGICMIPHGAALPDNSSFSQYVVSGAGASVALSPVTADQTLFYPTDGSNVNFTAFSPYAAVTDNKVSYTGFADQSAQAKMEAVDFLYHKGATAYNKANATAALTFSHRLSKIVINATTTADATAVTLSSLNMTITGMPGSATANLADGSVTPGGTDVVITPYHTDGTSSRTATAILSPHAAKAGRTVTFASTEGSFTYTLPDDLAFESNKMYTLNFSVTRRGVALSDATIDKWPAGTINWEGRYMLELADTGFVFNTKANPDTTITFKSNYGGTISVLLSSSETDAEAGVPDWVTGTLTSDDRGNHTQYTYKFKPQDNVTGYIRTAYAHVLGGNTSLAAVHLKQLAYEPASNCYIVKPGTTSFIPVSRANEHAAGSIGDAEAFTVEPVWVDTLNLLTEMEPHGIGATGAVKVTAAAGKTGNALVAVKVGGVIKWSWHIWVTDYDPNTNLWDPHTAGGKTIRNVLFMDRNLGALEAALSVAARGFHYQFGRKDPFHTGYDSIHFVSGPVSLDETIQNPTFYYEESEDEIHDWIIPQIDTLWGHNGKKTIYDPCPSGFRVPAGGEGEDSPWFGLDGQRSEPGPNAGIIWGGTSFWPTTGIRTGYVYLAGRDTHGGCWTATPVRVFVYIMSFDYSSFILTTDGVWRTRGLSVRCVKE